MNSCGYARNGPILACINMWKGFDSFFWSILNRNFKPDFFFRDQKRSDPWEAELDTEEPLSVRAKRLSKVTKTDSITECLTNT